MLKHWNSDGGTVAGTGITHIAGHIFDVNVDGFPDLVLHFNTTETGIACGDTLASLTGRRSADRPLKDRIR